MLCYNNLVTLESLKIPSIPRACTGIALVTVMCALSFKRESLLNFSLLLQDSHRSRLVWCAQESTSIDKCMAWSSHSPSPGRNVRLQRTITTSKHTSCPERSNCIFEPQPPVYQRSFPMRVETKKKKICLLLTVVQVQFSIPEHVRSVGSVAFNDGKMVAFVVLTSMCIN